MLKFLRRWVKGNKFSSSHLNEVIDLANQTNPLRGEGSAEVTQGTKGSSISVPLQTHPRQDFRAVIVSFLGYGQSPGVLETQIGTALYSARLIKETPAGIATDQIDIISVPIVGPGETDPFVGDIVVINEAETGTTYGGYLSVGQVVIVWPTSKQTADQPSSPPKKIYRTHLYRDEFWAKITGNNNIAGPYHYSFSELEDTTRPTLAVKSLGRSGTTTLRYAVNALDNNNYPQAVPNNTVVKMTQTFDQSSPSKVVFRFSYIDLSVGSYCDSNNPVYLDTPNCTGLSFQVDELPITGGVDPTVKHRIRVGWGGMTWIDYEEDSPVCNAKIVKLDQTQDEPSDSTDADYSSGSFIKVPIVWELSTSNIADPCASCASPSTKKAAVIKGFAFVSPGSGIFAYQDGFPIFTPNLYSNLNAIEANRMLLVDDSILAGTHNAIQIHWNGFTGADCNNSPVSSSGGPATDGFIGIHATNGLTADSTGAILNIKFIPPNITINVTSSGGSSGTYDVSSPCSPTLTLTIDVGSITVSFTISIGTVTTLPAGSSATASITGSYPSFTLNLGIPAGFDGTNGTNGTNGTDGTNGTNGAPGLNPTDLPDGTYPLSTGTGAGVITNNGSIVVSGGQITAINPIQFIA